MITFFCHTTWWKLLTVKSLRSQLTHLCWLVFLFSNSVLHRVTAFSKDSVSLVSWSVVDRLAEVQAWVSRWWWNGENQEWGSLEQTHHQHWSASARLTNCNTLSWMHTQVCTNLYAFTRTDIQLYNLCPFVFVFPVSTLTLFCPTYTHLTCTVLRLSYTHTYAYTLTLQPATASPLPLCQPVSVSQRAGCSGAGPHTPLTAHGEKRKLEK